MPHSNTSVRENFKIFSMNLSYADYVELNTDSVGNGYFLVDSQADISVVKMDSLSGEFE